MISTVTIVTSGCGFLAGQRGDRTTGDLTRGQQPATAKSGTHLEDIHHLVQQARGLYAEGRLRKAQKVLRAAREIDPQSPHVIQLEARIALDLGDMDAYRSALKHMLATHPDSAEIQNRIGKRLVENGQWDEGSSALSKAYQLAPHTVAYARDLAAACLERADDGTAADVLTEAMRWNPRDATIPVALARYYEAGENWQEAARYYDVALNSDVHNTAYLRQKARCLYRLGDYANACDLYSAFIESSTSRVALSEYAEFGDACLRIGDVERAQMVYDRISRYSPVRNREVELLRIVCAIRRGDRRHAERILRDAMTLWPNDDDFRKLVAEIDAPTESAESPDSP